MLSCSEIQRPLPGVAVHAGSRTLETFQRLRSEGCLLAWGPSLVARLRHRPGQWRVWAPSFWGPCQSPARVGVTSRSAGTRFNVKADGVQCAGPVRTWEPGDEGGQGPRAQMFPGACPRGWPPALRLPRPPDARVLVEAEGASRRRAAAHTGRPLLHRGLSPAPRTEAPVPGLPLLPASRPPEGRSAGGERAGSLARPAVASAGRSRPVLTCGRGGAEGTSALALSTHGCLETEIIT